MEWMKVIRVQGTLCRLNEDAWFEVARTEVRSGFMNHRTGGFGCVASENRA